MQWTEPAGKLLGIRRRDAGSATDRPHVIPRMKSAGVIIVVLVVIAAAALILAKGRTPTTALTAGETKVRDLVREVYAGNIVNERVERSGADAVLIAELQNEKLKELKINLLSLARKHEREGLSLPVIKRSLRFD